MLWARLRWLGLAVFCVLLAGCSSTTAALPRQQASGATRQQASPTATSTPRPARANIYYRTYDHTVYALNPADGSVRWTFFQGLGGYDPIAVGNLVYVDAMVGRPTYTLNALDSATGAVVWSAPGGAYPTVANGAVYVFVNDTLDCLDAGTGTLRWQRPTHIGRLTITDDTIYIVYTFVASQGAPALTSLTAINTADGAIRWTFARDPAQFDYPMAGDGVIYFHAMMGQYPNPYSGRLFALKATDGSQLWSVDAPAVANVFALADGVVYAGGSTTGISAYRTSDGALLWKNGDPAFARFTAVGNAVYINTFHGTVVALDATTGKQLWAAAVGGPGYAPIVTNGLLYVAAGRAIGQLVAINVRSGAIAWAQPTAGTPGPPVFAGNEVYTYSVQPDNGPSPLVYAFNAANGARLWQHQTGKNLETTLAVNGGLSGA